ncbi:serine hydrolase domain-containing protein [Daejeonella sp. JGW-45]|uniref:serine hydrolase domain-containing protein n=1 Tax=Daejeonella sp. JGW-45 TaxID=3034148 RepID=UPI0023EBA97F|nr:serine hydrolase domain-containing protein [Daejeonella sp. JGW-45]
MKRNILSILFVVAGALSAFGQVITTSTAEAAGFSSERLKRIDAAMNEWVDKGYLNGASALIVRNGKVAYYKAAGYNDLGTKTPMPRDGIFRIASQTKAITSVAIMMLFDEGKLLLSDPVSLYIPSFKGQSVLVKFNPADTTYTTEPAKREVTIKDLLTHTSGIGYAQIGSREANAIYAKSNLTAGIGMRDASLQDAMSRLGKLPLMHQPGERFTYGLNTDVLGALVEVVSGLSLDEFFRTRIFEPLGMKDTYFNLPQAKAARLVNLYTEKPDGTLVKASAQMLNGPVTPAYPLEKTTYFSGGAGLSSTIYDYAIFLQMLLNNGEYNGKRILARNTVRMMTVNQVGEVSISNDDKFGLGFQIVTEKSSGRAPAQVGTFGWGGAFGTSYWVDPKEKMVLLIYRQMQARTHNEVIEKFRALAYGAIQD